MGFMGGKCGKHGMRVATLWCLMLFASAALADDDMAAPMTRAEFSKLVFRGVPKQDVLKALGKPSAENPGASGSVELVYLDRIRQAGAAKPEKVTVIIFSLYQTVGSVRWADGTVTEWRRGIDVPP